MLWIPNELSAPYPFAHPLAIDSQLDQRECKVRLLRSGCRGVVPLDGILSPWMVDVLSHPSLQQWVDQFESPLNVMCEAPFETHVRDLATVADNRNLDLQIHFARKANKCLHWIDAAKRLNIALDVASDIELQQTLDQDFDPAKIICTAAVKSIALVQRCVSSGVTLVVDNADELSAIQSVASGLERPAQIAIRISGFQHQGHKLSSRFGFDIDEFTNGAASFSGLLAGPWLTIVGLHFHLNGNSIRQRVSAIQQILPLVDARNHQGPPIEFIDIGGGIPVRYLQCEDQWTQFQDEHTRSLLKQRDAITFDRHGLGRIAGDGKSDADACTVADAVRDRGLQLRCEPGRSLMEGCGMTVARVEFCKKHPSGYSLIGLSMNRSQCRTTDDEFLIDPILVSCASDRDTSESEAIDGFLVGAYCTEFEFLSLRRFHFPRGVKRGDLIVFPNTAGYQMHFLESRSHQFALAKNVFVDELDSQHAGLDAIDR